MFRTPAQLEDLVLVDTADVKTAVSRLDQGGTGFVAVVDEDKKLRGVLTNGDFRKYILRGGSLMSPVTLAMNANPVTITQTKNLGESALPILEDPSILYIPVLDASGCVVDIVSRQDLATIEEPGAQKSRLPSDCVAVIMAGGRGTRLDPFTRILPKALIPIGKKPIVELIMERFAAHGVGRFLISVNHMARMVRAYFEDSPGDYEVGFLSEDQPLGTAGCLRLLEGKIEEPFFVINCDVIILGNYGSVYDFHIDEGNDLTIVGSVREHAIPYGVCEIDNEGELSRLVEKPSYEVLVNTGMYMLSPHLLERIPEGRSFDMTDLIEDLLAGNGKVGVYPVSEKAWLDVGQWEEYRKTMQQLGET